MKRKAFFLAVLSICFFCESPTSAQQRPNILIILADDLGFGDVKCYNPERGKISTPHIDRLASQGMQFTDAHSSSSVCSPTRYSLLTGRYHWRSRLQQGIVQYLEEPLIPPDRLTLASLLKQNGYRTAAIGKWHLGWDPGLTDEEKRRLKSYGGKPGGGGKFTVLATDEDRAVWNRIYSREFKGGPITLGFDSYFGTDVPNWPPYCFIENNRTVGIPDELLAGKWLQANQASFQGPALPGWNLDEVLPTLTNRAVAMVGELAKKPEPFFLYLPLTSPHTPIAVSKAWRGKSGLNAYADFVMQTDDAVGQVLAELERSGAAENTIVIFTSDNGFATIAGLKELEAAGHFPSGPLRGYKRDAWEGGHRLPFIVRWPGTVPADSRCNALVQQSDLMATIAEILQTKLPESAGEDSISLLPLLRGDNKPVREHSVSQAASGLLALRKGNWKIIFGAGNGDKERKLADMTKGQLYDLSMDLAETKNLWDQNPELVKELQIVMQKFIDVGRSTPGAKQENEVPVRWRRFMSTAGTKDNMNAEKGN